jgi:signal transduction histidine kinase
MYRVAAGRKRTSSPQALGDSTQSGSRSPSVAGSRVETVLSTIRTAAIGLACVLFVAVASVARMVPADQPHTGTGVTVDQHSVVINVDPGSRAWELGIRTGWSLVASEPSASFYEDSLGNGRSLPSESVVPPPPAIVTVLPSLAVLGLAGVLMLLKLRNASVTAAVLATAVSAPVFVTRPDGVGDLVALAPIAIAAGATLRMGAALGIRPRARRPMGPFLRSFAVPFVVAPAVVFAAATMSAGLVAGVAAATVAYLSLAWIVVVRWRVGVARLAVQAENRGSTGVSSGSRFTRNAAVIAYLMPFSDRIRRRGAQAERDRLASDLHAELLPAIAMTASELDRRGATNEAEQLRSLASNVRDLVSERRLPVLEEEGLVAAAEWLAESIQDRTTVAIEINLDGSDGSRQPADVERAAYRVLQLALDNVVRHSGAAHALVEIRGGASILSLSVGDDGHGIDPGAAVRSSRTGHLGLSDMQAEAKAVGASLRIEARLPQGTTIEMKWRA